MICSIFNLIWNTIFMEKWKRKNSELSLNWGIFDLDITDQPRAQFYGEQRVSPITGKLELYYSK